MEKSGRENAMATEGNLQAPTRHAIDWKTPDYYNEDACQHEIERIFDICHGCRRCVSLCGAFPTLFDLIDASKTGEVDGVDKKDYRKVVDQCYLCDLCYMTKCPYVPPHKFNLDFPHTMLRAKVIKVKDGEKTPGKVAIFSTCYINYNEPGIGHDLLKILSHNEVPYVLVEKEKCCGMPRLELGDLDSVNDSKEANIPVLARYAKDGFAILSAVPSCTLMFKQEIPLMYPDDADV